MGAGVRDGAGTPPCPGTSDCARARARADAGTPPCVGSSEGAGKGANSEVAPLPPAGLDWTGQVTAGAGVVMGPVLVDSHSVPGQKVSTSVAAAIRSGSVGSNTGPFPDDKGAGLNGAVSGPASGAASGPVSGVGLAVGGAVKRKISSVAPEK